MPMELVLNHPTVLELEGMGDNDDKAFVMGLMFIRLVEHRRQVGQLKNLEHLLVIEEAHRLLTNVGERREEEGNARGKAVEISANLLAEIRAYGQGVLISDQVPEKLAPDVIKNTNLKITHRTVHIGEVAGSSPAKTTKNR
jgi:DNA helicase HerA-like ATPase